MFPGVDFLLTPGSTIGVAYCSNQPYSQVSVLSVVLFTNEVLLGFLHTYEMTCLLLKTNGLSHDALPTNHKARVGITDN